MTDYEKYKCFNCNSYEFKIFVNVIDDFDLKIVCLDCNNIDKITLEE